MVLTPVGLVEASRVERQSRTDVQRHHDLPHALVGYRLDLDAAADTDVEQLAFEIYALPLLVHHDAGLYGFDAARSRGLRAYERLIDTCSPT